MSVTIKHYNIIHNYSYAIFKTEDIQHLNKEIIFPNEAKPLTCGYDKQDAEKMKKIYENIT